MTLISQRLRMLVKVMVIMTVARIYFRIRLYLMWFDKVTIKLEKTKTVKHSSVCLEKTKM